MRSLSWPATAVVALLTAVAACVATGFVAERWASWHVWDQREGAAGYAVVAWGLLGLVVGLVTGVVVARRLGPVLAGSFVRTLGASLALVLVPAAAMYGIGRHTADLTPRLDGATLHVQVELRWPAAQDAAPAVPEGGTGRVRYERWAGDARRASATGLLWIEDARRDAGGRWVASGVAPIGSARGRRASLSVVLDPARPEATTHRFEVPLRGAPQSADLAWSGWLEGAGGFALRYRVVPRTAVVRTERVGPFAVEVIAHGFAGRPLPDGSEAPDDSGGLTVRGPLVVRFGGEIVRPSPAVEHAWGDPAARAAGADAVVLVPGARPALLAIGGPYGNGTLIVAEGDTVRAQVVTRSQIGDEELRPVTNDAARFRDDRGRRVRKGAVDRATLATPGQYVLGDAVLDTRTLAVRPLPQDSTVTTAYEAVPLAGSPDGRSVVRYGVREPAEPADAAGDAEPSTQPVLLVSDVAAGRAYAVPIDPARMRYPHPDALDPAWVAHHFAWERGADGVDRLVPRAAFAPLPHRGHVNAVNPSYPEYQVPGVRPAFAEEVVAIVARATGGERLPAQQSGEVARVRAGERVLKVAYYDRGAVGTVSVQEERVPGDRALLDRVARAVDDALATGRFDALVRP